MHELKVYINLKLYFLSSLHQVAIALFGSVVKILILPPALSRC